MFEHETQACSSLALLVGKSGYNLLGLRYRYLVSIDSCFGEPLQRDATQYLARGRGQTSLLQRRPEKRILAGHFLQFASISQRGA